MGSRAILFVAYEGAELLDITGPMEVFHQVNRELNNGGKPPYTLTLLAEKPGPFATSSGVKLVANAGWQEHLEEMDSLIVVGGPDEYLYRAMANRSLLDWLRRSAPQARRLVSVCAGVFLLAEAGLLDGRRVTTHWMEVEQLISRYPNLTVEPDAIYVRDGNIATSAGITAGMDLALALVEEDFGRKVALAVARRLVMYLKRPGGQTQFSLQLRAQMVAGGPLAPLLAWIEKNFHRRLTVEVLASEAAMSPRNFARIFLRETGMTPARYLDQLRLEQSIRLLEETGHPVAVVARESGFGSAERLRRAFQRYMGIPPLAYRARF